jgi:hypothetical protein
MIQRKQTTIILLSILVVLIIYFILEYYSLLDFHKGCKELPRDMWTDILSDNGRYIVLTKIDFHLLEELFIFIVLAFSGIIILNIKKIMK